MTTSVLITSAREPLQVIASTSDEAITSEEVSMGFQYQWTVRVSKRLVENGDEMVLNVSPPFTTAFNGVAFTWALRLCDECVVDAPDNGANSFRQVFLMLYYKDGPASEVHVEDVRMTISDPNTGAHLFTAPLVIPNAEYTKGSGWAVQLEGAAQSAFTHFIHAHVDGAIDVRCDFRLKTSLFRPLAYIPSVDSAYRSQRIEKACMQFIEDVQTGRLIVPGVEASSSGRLTPVEQEFPSSSSNECHAHERFAHHRRILVFGCDQVEQECLREGSSGDEDELLKHVRSTFAHVYFKNVLMSEVHFFEDFVAMLEGVFSSQLPHLKRECERFICREVMSGKDNEDLCFTKKMLIVSERFGLEHLKMVSSGVLVDALLAENSCKQPDQQLGEMRDELKQIASEISTSCESLDQPSEDLLVGAVVDDLQSLAQRMRRVSLSHSPSLGSTSSSPPSSSSVTPTCSPAHSPAAADSPRPFDGDSSPATASRFKRVALDRLDDTWYVYPDPPHSHAASAEGPSLLQC